MSARPWFHKRCAGRSVRSRTKVDVRWQDTTLTTNEPACELVPVLLDGNDFQPVRAVPAARSQNLAHYQRSQSGDPARADC